MYICSELKIKNMKKLFTVGMVLISFLSYGQTYTINVDFGQQFDHDSSYSTNDAIKNNKINYLNSGSTNLTFVFDFDKMTASRQFNGEDAVVNKIIVNTSDKTNIVNVFVKYDDGIRNYTVFKNENEYFFVSRTYEENKLTGWFDNSVKIKKRP